MHGDKIYTVRKESSSVTAVPCSSFGSCLLMLLLCSMTELVAVLVRNIWTGISLVCVSIMVSYIIDIIMCGEH